MDNASKALIMAGAILISVAIVGIGIYIFSTANALTDDAVGQIDALAVSSVNSRIEVYLGDEVRGSQVEQLVNEINAINAQNSMPSVITISGFVTTGTNTDGSSYYVSSAIANGRYDVAAAYASNGYISSITITED